MFDISSLMQDISSKILTEFFNRLYNLWYRSQTLLGSIKGFSIALLIPGDIVYFWVNFSWNSWCLRLGHTTQTENSSTWCRIIVSLKKRLAITLKSQ